MTIVLLLLSVLVPPAILPVDAMAAARLWTESSAHGYCVLVPLVSLAFVVADRRALAAMAPTPWPWGLAVLAAAAAAWAVGQWAAIAELRQLAVVALMQGMAVTLLGRRIYRRARFPLLYLFLMVPTGTLLLPLLQAVTVVLSTALLKLAGLKLTVEGAIIGAPLRAYHVESACAGLNYLLVALAVALPYARLVYCSGGKRAACVAAAVAAAILANGVRVAAIILLPEITAGRIDVIADHKMLGWAVFAAVAMAAMGLGLVFEDHRPRPGISKLSSHQ